MSISAIDPTNSDLLQQTRDAQSQAAAAAAAAQLTTFQAQLEQSQGQPTASGDNKPHAHHHGGHHHGQVGAAGGATGASSKASASTQPSLADLFDAIPNGVSAASDSAETTSG